MKLTIFVIAMGVLAGCNQQMDAPHNEEEIKVSQASWTEETSSASETSQSKSRHSNKIRTGDISPEELVNYAMLFYGVPYKYGSADPNKGFDCSGFINYVYNHFDIGVPRSSVDFTNIGTDVEVDEANPGDLILFTGTDPSTRQVGHIGIVVKNDNSGLEFIHSSSGKQYAVTITPLSDYYMERFVKVVRVI